MLADARNIAEGASLEFDVVIVGAGPAGIAIADRLRSARARVALLEAGGTDLELRTQRLYRGVNRGRPYFALDACRHRMFGGSSNRWGGWCRPLDPVDFERRDWIPGSGWPISHEDVSPYHGAAAELLELETDEFDLGFWGGKLPAPLPLDGETFEHAIVQYSPKTNFAERYGTRVNAAPNVTTLMHANVCELALEPGTARVSAARVRTLDGGSFSVRATVFVLAAGGIENARLLLASRSSRPSGIGNEHDLVGRCFMEHVHVNAGHVVASGDRLPADFYEPRRYGDASACGVITPSEHGLRTHGLPSCSIAVGDWAYAMIGTQFLGWSSAITSPPVQVYRRLRSWNPALTARLRRQIERPWVALRRIQTVRAERAARARAARTVMADAESKPMTPLYFRAEQVPNRTSRVALTGRRDELGMPLTQLEWRLAEIDRDGVTRWLALLDRAFASAGVGRVVLPADGWEENIIGGPHHMGTTRMSATPREGVVDKHCRVHSTDNLYVAGSSVFTTGGHANPTMTLVALAVRLADRLRDVLGA